MDPAPNVSTRPHLTLAPRCRRRGNGWREPCGHYPTVAAGAGGRKHSDDDPASSGDRQWLGQAMLGQLEWIAERTGAVNDVVETEAIGSALVLRPILVDSGRSRRHRAPRTS
jgi:hypothetical protein